MNRFGNFRAIVAYPVKRAYVQKPDGTVDLLRVNGETLEFVDNNVIDTPRIPTTVWINYGILKAKNIASDVNHRSRVEQSNFLNVEVKFDLESLELFFYDSNRPVPYKYPIMDFILATDASQVNDTHNRIYSHFVGQQPLA